MAESEVFPAESEGSLGVLTTLIRPEAGTAVIDGIDVVRHPERIRLIIGVSADTPRSTRT